MNNAHIISRYTAGSGRASAPLAELTRQCDCDCDCACIDQLTHYTAAVGQCDCNCDCACMDRWTDPSPATAQCDCPDACQDEGELVSLGQCDCNCDCACLDQAGRAGTLRSGLVSDSLWRRPAMIYAAPLGLPPSFGPAGEPYILAFNPHAGQAPAILDPAAARLWDRFATPTYPAALVASSDMAPGETRRALGQLAALRLIEPENAGGEPACADTPTTLAAWLHVTNACNLRCAYCYLAKTAEAMSSETGRLAIEAIFRSAVAGGFRSVKLKYAGGEPTLNFERVLELHRHAQVLAARHGLRLDGVVLSNGVSLSDKLLAALQAHGLRLMISLDGVGAMHDTQRTFPDGQGSFSWVARGIERALAHGVTPDISVVVSDRNAAGLPELVAWVLERGLPFGLNFYRENDCSASRADLQLSARRIIAALRAAYQVIADNLPRRSLLDSLLDRANLAVPHRRTCGVGRNYLVIDHHGQVSKCQMDMARPVTDVRAGDPLCEVRADRAGLQNLAVEDKQGCRECAWQHWCTGSCPLYTYRVTGRYDVRSPNCEIYKALFPEVLRLEGLRLLKYAGPAV